jgi:eukaryotic-like serine/threonine-protein kinase
MMNQPLYTPGTIIAGKYKIERAIARGGCSIVYRGLHQDMGRQVALKLMAAEDGTDMSAWAERFRREARLASQLRHRNTITTFDYGAEGDLLYIAMEWVDGDSMRNVIKKEGAMEPLRAARLSAQMLRSLNEAHGLGILHRDLKPSNIMLTTDADGVEILKVLDFGLAKAQLDPQTQTQLLKLTQDGDFVGTPRYASPEQLKGRELTTASDIYGVGMVMWEMLTGKPAVPDIDFGTCVQYHLGSQPWELPEEIHCPVGLAHIVEGSLAKKAEERFQTCEAMLAVLDAWIANPRLDSSPAASGSWPAPAERPLPPTHALFGDPSTESPKLSPPDLFGELTAPDSPPRREAEELFSSLDMPPRPAMVTPEEAPPAIMREQEVWPAPAPGESLPPRTAPEPAPAPRPNANFAQVDGSKIEVDRRAARAAAPATAPASRGAAIAAPRPGVQESVADSEARKKQMALGALLLLALALGAALFFSGKKPVSSQTTEPDEVVADTTPKAPATAKRETPSADVLLVAIKRAGWSTVGAQDSTELGDIRQTTARVTREGQLADLTIYECDERSVAFELMGNTELPARAVRIGRTVIRISPLPGKSASPVVTIQEYMYKIRDIYENGANGAPPKSDDPPEAILPPTP